MTSKVVIPNIPHYHMLDDVPTFDSWTTRSMITEIGTEKNAKLNKAGMIKFEYSGEDYIRLGSPRTGFKVKAKFLTKSRANDRADFAGNRNAHVTFEANWFHHLWSKYEIKAGSEPLERIDYPGEATDIICHLKGLDFRQKSGENIGFIADENTGEADSMPDLTASCPIRKSDLAGVTGAADDTGAGSKAFNVAVNAREWNKYNSGFLRRIEKYNYKHATDTDASNDTEREIELFIPLNVMFGFCETYDKVTKFMPFIIELTRRDPTQLSNVFFGATNTTVDIQLDEITFHVDVLEPKPELSLTLDKRYEKGPLEVTYLQRHIECITSSEKVVKWKDTQFSHPRYVFIICKGTGDAVGQSQIDRNYSLCRHCNIEDVRISLDGKWYPDKSYNTDFAINQFSQFYDTYANICEAMSGSCGITAKEFKELYTVYCIDLNDQKDKLTNSTTNLNFEITRRKVPKAPEYPETAVNPASVEYYVMVIDEVTYSMDLKKKIAVKM